MRGFLIFLFIIIGLGLVGKTLFDLQGQKRYMFKNNSILKRQRISFLTGMIGVFLLVIVLLILIF